MVPKSKVKKLDPRPRESMMAGYASNSKGHKLWEAKLNKFIISRDLGFDESISDPRSQVNNERSPSSKSALNIEIDSGSDQNDDETSQIEDSELLVDEYEDESENDDQSESQIQPQNNQSKTDSPQIEHCRSNRVSKKPQTTFDPSKYKSKQKTQKSNSSTLAVGTQFDSRIMPMYKSTGANLHSRGHFNYETGI